MSGYQCVLLIYAGAAFLTVVLMFVCTINEWRGDR